MTLLLRWAAAAVALVHRVFVRFVVCGGLGVGAGPGWRAPSAGGGLGAWIEFAGGLCPLTPWKTPSPSRRPSRLCRGLRGSLSLAAALSGGLTREGPWALGAGVLVFNIGVYGVLRFAGFAGRGRRGGGSDSDPCNGWTFGALGARARSGALAGGRAGDGRPSGRNLGRNPRGGIEGIGRRRVRPRPRSPGWRIAAGRRWRHCFWSCWRRLAAGVAAASSPRAAYAETRLARPGARGWNACLALRPGRRFEAERSAQRHGVPGHDRRQHGANFGGGQIAWILGAVLQVATDQPEYVGLTVGMQVQRRGEPQQCRTVVVRTDERGASRSPAGRSAPESRGTRTTVKRSARTVRGMASTERISSRQAAA